MAAFRLEGAQLMHVASIEAAHEQGVNLVHVGAAQNAGETRRHLVNGPIDQPVITLVKRAPRFVITR